MMYFVRILCAAALLLGAAAQAQPQPAIPAAAPVAPASPVAGDRNNTLADSLPPEQILWLSEQPAPAAVPAPATPPAAPAAATATAPAAVPAAAASAATPAAADAGKFLARFIPDLSGAPRGAVIVLHDSGQHPSWPITVAAVLDDLPLHGWNTLAIELPAPAQEPPAAASPAPASTTAAAATPAAPNTAASTVGTPATPGGASATPAAPVAPALEQRAQLRIAAALRYFAEQKQTNVALIGFGSGAWRAAEFVRQSAAANAAGTTAPITALALIAPLDRLPEGGDDLPKLLPATGLPAIDLVLNSDPLARAEAEQRRRAVLHQRSRVYQQLLLPPLNGEVNARHNLMVKRVRGFLQQQIGGPLDAHFPEPDTAKNSR